jgi:hypothetical protein
MATCSKCGAEAPTIGDLRHNRDCPWQTPHERIKELEEGLRLARYEINRVLETP